MNASSSRFPEKCPTGHDIAGDVLVAARLAFNMLTGRVVGGRNPDTTIHRGTLKREDFAALAEHTLDGRSDLYSVGCVLYDALTGHRSFMGEAVAGPNGHLHVTPLETLRPDLGPEICAWVMNLLEPVPGGRPGPRTCGGDPVRSLPGGGEPRVVKVSDL